MTASCWLVVAVAVFAFALNVAFARAANASEDEASANDAAEQPSAEAQDRRRRLLEHRAARRDALFAKADADEDGRLSADEFAAADFDGLMRGRGGHRARHGGERGPRMGRKLDEEDFAVADEDGNGQLSPQEFEAFPQAQREARRKRLFERMDGNGDGYLSMDEFSVRMGRRHNPRGAHGGARAGSSKQTSG